MTKDVRIGRNGADRESNSRGQLGLSAEIDLA